MHSGVYVPLERGWSLGTIVSATGSSWDKLTHVWWVLNWSNFMFFDNQLPGDENTALYSDALSTISGVRIIDKVNFLLRDYFQYLLFSSAVQIYRGQSERSGNFFKQKTFFLGNCVFLSVRCCVFLLFSCMVRCGYDPMIYSICHPQRWLPIPESFSCGLSLFNVYKSICLWTWSVFSVRFLLFCVTIGSIW